MTNQAPPQRAKIAMVQHGTEIASCTAPEWCVYSRLTNWVVLVFGATGWGKWWMCFSFWGRRGGGQLGCFVRVVMFSNLNPLFNLHLPPGLGCGLLLFVFFMAVPWRMAFNELGGPHVQMTSVDYCCVSRIKLSFFSHDRGQVSLFVTLLFQTCIPCCHKHDLELWHDTAHWYCTKDYTIHITHVSMPGNNMAAEWSSVTFVLSPLWRVFNPESSHEFPVPFYFHWVG